MATYFLDSSAPVKRYVQETGSAWVIGITAPGTGNRIYACRLTIVEVLSAISRQRRHGAISPVDASKVIADLRHDFAMQYVVIEITLMLVDAALGHADSHALRAYDAVQLAAALEAQTQRLASGMPGIALISADRELNAAATAEGLVVDDPNMHP